MKLTAENIAVVDGDTHLSRWIEEQRTLEVAEGYCRLFTRFIPRGGCVLDIGACLGDHTATYSKMVGPEGLVHAFEPNPLAFECLWYNMQPYSNVVVHDTALGDIETGVTIVRPVVAEKNLGASQVEVGGSIPMTTLDKESAGWTRLPNFIKIDAEGWEPRIIKGGLQLIARCRPVLLVEINRPILANAGLSDQDIFGPLAKLGYHFEPCEPHLSLNLEQIDALCLP